MYGYGMFLSANGKPVSSDGGLTARTTAFKTATGITDATILNALNTFDLGLISHGLDTKMKALYPFIGGTSTTNSYNFMNTSQYQLTFYGGWTHNSNGATPNGTNAYADTSIVPSTVFGSTPSIGCSFYSRTNNTGYNYRMPFGVDNYDSTSFLYLQRNSGDTSQIRVCNAGYTGLTATVTNTTGLFTITRSDSTTASLYRNGSNLINNTLTFAGNPTLSIYIGANHGATAYYDNENYGLFSFHLGLNSTEVSTLYSLIQTMQTSLSRQV